MIDLRLLWTWDHCTQWTAARAGVHDWGASNEYSGRAEDFLREYSLLLRWCGRHGIDGVVVWGLLRDGHGGVEAAKRLCGVAEEAGVKLLAGVGLNAYGGAYYEGASEWSLDNHLAKHPELYAQRADGRRHVLQAAGNAPQPMRHACPSRRENMEYCQDSLRWLMETVPLAGVQVETGDTYVCECPLCRERRRHPVSAFSWEDMALLYPAAAEAVWSVRPDATVVLETYSHAEPDAGPAVPSFGGGSPPWAAECLAGFPARAHVQWAMDKIAPPRSSAPWTTPAPSGFAGNIARTHVSTWWRGRGDELAVDWLAALAQQSLAQGFDGISMFGDKSPFRTGCELNYLAFADYGSAANPEADLGAFLDRVAGPLLGGAELAAEFLRLAREIDDPQRLPGAAAKARRHAARLSGRPAERWTWLAWYLSRWIYDEANG